MEILFLCSLDVLLYVVFKLINSISSSVVLEFKCYSSISYSTGLNRAARKVTLLVNFDDQKLSDFENINQPTLRDS